MADFPSQMLRGLVSGKNMASGHYILQRLI